MKTLVLVRHAKAQRDALAGDHARALSDRGLRNAAAIGAYLRTVIGAPDTVITSDATRALRTAEIVANEVGVSAPITIEPRIYGANVATLINVVRAIPDGATTVVLVGHNPGFEDLTEALAGLPAGAVRLPTAGVAILNFDAARWATMQAGSGRVREVATPRTIAP
jgi:phosphohistidine phosphatase